MPIDRARWWMTSALFAAACGARSDIGAGGTAGDGEDVGATVASSSRGAVSATSVSNASSNASSGAGGASCASFVVDGSPVRIADFTRSPQLAVEGATMRVAWHFGRFVFSQSLDPANRWPETFTDVEEEMHIGDDGHYAMAPLSPTPVFLYTENGSLSLTGVGSSIDPTPAAVFGDATHFVARNGDTTLQAASSNSFLQTGSYRVDGLAQSEPPTTCVATGVRPAAVTTNDGFLAVFADAADEGTSCSAPVPPPATSVLLRRYDLPAASALSSTTTAFVRLGEPIDHLGLARTERGAWLVYQTDGSTSRTAPPAMAMRVGADGVPLAEAIAVSPDSSGSIDLAVAGMGEALVLARVPVEKAAPTVVVSRIEDDGTLRPGTTLTLGSPVVQGTVRVLATPDARSVLVSWETNQLESFVAKLDCAP